MDGVWEELVSDEHDGHLDALRDAEALARAQLFLAALPHQRHLGPPHVRTDRRDAVVRWIPAELLTELRSFPKVPVVSEARAGASWAAC